MSETVSKHFVVFYSPGTFFPETTTREVPEWNPIAALRLAREIVERYDARPYCFRFITRGRSDGDLDSKVIAEDRHRYFIDGKVETREEIEARNDPKEQTLRDNMRWAKIARIVITCSPWKNAAALEPGDIVLNADGAVIHEEPAAKETDNA